EVGSCPLPIVGHPIERHEVGIVRFADLSVRTILELLLVVVVFVGVHYIIFSSPKNQRAKSRLGLMTSRIFLSLATQLLEQVRSEEHTSELQSRRSPVCRI